MVTLVVISIAMVAGVSTILFGLSERQAEMRRTPLAMLTAYATDQHQREATEAGADFHIVKPVTPVSLLAGLEKAIRASKSADAA